MTSLTVGENAVELLKTDTLGRVRTSRARREAILDEFERSGGSGQQFAALLGIKYPTFANWRQQRHRERAGWKKAEGGLAEALPGGATTLSWVEVERRDEPVSKSMPTPGAAVRVQLPGGAQLEMTQLEQAPLLAALLCELDGERERPC